MNLRPSFLKSPNIPVIAWITYDTGNTVFFTGVMGLLFPLWITKVMGGDDATLGFTLAIAMAIVFFISPILGTVSDQTGKRRSFLVVFTILFITSGLFIGVSGLEVSLAFFGLGVIARVGLVVVDLLQLLVVDPVARVRHGHFHRSFI